MRLLLLFTVVPLVELALLLVIAQHTSWQFTLLLVLVTGIVGATLARHEGLRCWQRVHEELAAGRLPGDSLLDALMILVAGALLVTPGVLTDVVGFALLLPIFRRWVKDHLRRHYQARFHVATPPNGWGEPGTGPKRDEIIDTRVIDVPPEESEEE